MTRFSKRSHPGCLEATIGSLTRFFLRFSDWFSSATLTLRSTRLFTEHPRVAAAVFSRRYRGSGISTVVRMIKFYHIYGSLCVFAEELRMAETGDKVVIDHACPLH